MIFSKYLSHWYGFVLYIWLLAYYFQFNIITELINPYYIALAFCFGYLVIEACHIFYRKNYHQFSFLLYKILLHVIPLYILIYINYREKKGALLSFLVISIPYFIYIHKNNKSLYTVYFKDFYPTKWSDLEKLCEKNNVPICFLKNLFNN
tara:strand:- start:446 stop:895 length:450 start_codon:yes stop_codon:yes gene_type:complete